MSSTPQLDRIVTPRLLLRRYTRDDADLDNIARLIADPRVMRYYPQTYDREEAAAWVDAFIKSYEKRGYSLLVVERLSDGAYLGHIGLLHWDDVDAREDVEVAYMLCADEWGHGYAIEAARACRDWAFENLDPDRVVSFISVENAPSIKVAERNGMTRIKRLDENRLKTPIYVYAIEREEWDERQP
ncbi:MAG TPA: GNAT family N-acetyltransferase [Candidatus Cybelea sp.]|jgi:RimJ/RimL family protein N-acetyltransferase|nr:GNAT family N-acetyltransferase [Candidatus Cybelea sp.]